MVMGSVARASQLLPAPKLVHLPLTMDPRALEGRPLLTTDVVRGLGLEGLDQSEESIKSIDQ